MQTIYHFQKRLSQRLMIWSVLSIVIGLALQFSRSVQARGFGQQAATWGAIDAGIAGLGLRGAAKKLDDPAAYALATQAKERRNLGRLLWINAGLDVLYMFGGLALARRDDPDNKGWFGHGWGIVVQGAFLFLFDLIHARNLPDPTDR
jgi:hypothetical protein